MIGRSLAHYRILEKLGAGGMGEVFLAEDSKLERQVALKILAPEVAGDPEHFERFRREARAVAAVSHPNIVTVHSVEEDQGLHYFTMEYVDGGNLGESAPAGGFALSDLVAWAIPLADALAAAHAVGIVHRDLKPGNVMVSARGEVKVLDFGLAKRGSADARGADDALTRVGALIGTVAYMAPEQIRGAEIDERADLFAAGVLIYEMAAGRHPFGSGDRGDLITAILNDQPPPVSATKPELGTGLDRVMARCLEKEPGDRFQSAAELRRALMEVERESTKAAVTLPLPTPAFEERRAPDRPEVWSLPQSRNLNFTGRDDEIDQLRQLVETAQRAVPMVAVVGLGGVGKTQLAVEYSYRFAGEYRTVWWMAAEQPAGLRGQYAALAGELGLTVSQDVERTVARVRDWLGANRGWLLVFDNAEEPAGLRPYLPSGGKGHVLVTSRNPAWRELGRVLKVSVWQGDRAAVFLERRTGDPDAESARALSEALGGLPLALEHAAAYIEASGQSVASYLRLFGEQRRRLLSQEESSASVLATWDLSFQQVTRESEPAEQLLKLCAFLAPEDIPLDLLAEGGDPLPEPLRGSVGDDLSLDQILVTLLRYSLVNRGEGSMSMHRLVQAAVRRALGNKTSIWAERALSLVSAAFPNESYSDTRAWPRCTQLLPHAVSCLDRLGPQPAPAAAALCGSVGTYLNGRGRYLEARPYLERALKIDEAARGPDHLQMANRHHALGRLCIDIDDLHLAKSHFERALRIEESARGPDHPKVAKRLMCIGVVLNLLHEPTEASKLLRRALAIDEAAFGPDDPAVARCLNNLGTAHMLSTETTPPDPARARSHFDRALRIFEDSFGPDHPDVARMTMNIGCVLMDQKRLAEAKGWLERAIGITEKALGSDHPALAKCLTNLGQLHRDMGNFNDAGACLDQALAIEREAFAGSHREVGFTLEQLGILAIEEGSEEEARRWLRRSLQELEDTLGSGHVETVRVRGRLEELDS